MWAIEKENALGVGVCVCSNGPKSNARDSNFGPGRPSSKKTRDPDHGRVRWIQRREGSKLARSIRAGWNNLRRPCVPSPFTLSHRGGAGVLLRTRVIPADVCDLRTCGGANPALGQKPDLAVRSGTNHVRRPACRCPLVNDLVPCFAIRAGGPGRCFFVACSTSSGSCFGQVLLGPSANWELCRFRTSGAMGDTAAGPSGS